MTGTTRRRFGVLVAVGVLATTVGTSSFTASGQSAPEAGPNLVPYGTLTINLSDRSGTVVLDRDGTADDKSEVIVTAQPCAAIEPGSGKLLTLSPTPGSSTVDTVQIRDSAIGVNTGNTSCGASAAAVLSGNEQLKIDLGSTPALPAGVYMKSASLLLTQLKKGDLDYKLDDAAAFTRVPYQTSPITVAPSINTVADLFTSITLKSSSLRDNEGLSVFSGTSFELVTFGTLEAAVSCGEQVTQLGGALDIADKAVFLRGQNTVKAPTQPSCVDVGVSVDILTLPSSIPGVPIGGGATDQRVVFWNNERTGLVDSSLQAVNATITIDWKPIPVAESARLDRQIDYDGPGTAATFTKTLWCESFNPVTMTGVLPNYVGPGSVMVGGVSKAPWCLVSDTRRLNGNTISQTEVLFGSGDPYRG